ncbi:hypothetical protein SAMN02745203_00370 [Porphyromonas crevioricanis]|nr:hypothetical protein SAMN02745203_00370 [Porphyromonas crevioricanis]
MDVKLLKTFLEVFWVSLISLFSGHLSQLSINFKNPIDYPELIKVLCLVSAIVLLTRFRIVYHMIFERADRRRIEDEISQNKVLDINKYFSEEWENSNPSRRRWWVLGIVLLFIYILDWNYLLSLIHSGSY